MRQTEADCEPGAWCDALRHIRRFFALRGPEAWRLLEDSASEWNADNAPRLGASIAFYTMLSLAPLLVLIVGVAALAFGKEAAQGQLFWQIRGLVGREEAAAIQGLLQSAYKPRTGILATVLGLLTLAFGASSVVVEVRDALNLVWHVPLPQSGPRLRTVMFLIRERFYGFALVLGVGFLLLVSLVVSAWVAAMGSLFKDLMPTSEWLLHTANFAVSFLIITGLFAAVYKLLPEVRLKWSDVAVGALFTSLLFTTGKQLIAIYLGKAGVGSTYGAAGSLVLVLVWVYYSAQLFLFGAEFTKVYTKSFGSHLEAKFDIHPQANPIGSEPALTRTSESPDKRP